MIIRQSAFCDQKKMLKGGLHCHTTRSDGACTPEEVMHIHAEHGYDFLALTDHEIYNYKNFAPETGITVIPGMEYGAVIKNIKGGFRCYHILCLGYLDDENKLKQDEVYDMRWVETQEEVQEDLDFFHKNKNLTIYCHPEWSSTPTRYFDKLKGNFAMEVWNTGCVMGNDQDKNAPYWNEVIGLGQKIYGVAVDDGHARDQHCGGWVMVNAENDVNSILDALKDGKFYSTCGPIIEDFYVDTETQMAHIKCSPCVQFDLCADPRPTSVVRCPEGKCEMEFWCGDHNFVRASIVDAEGRRAWTNPIFLR